MEEKVPTQDEKNYYRQIKIQEIELYLQMFDRYLISIKTMIEKAKLRALFESVGIF